jgi:hypothetical protein
MLYAGLDLSRQQLDVHVFALLSLPDLPFV